jgi:hypothetical protein
VKDENGDRKVAVFRCLILPKERLLVSFPFKGKAGMGMVLRAEVSRLNTIPTQPSP